MSDFALSQPIGPGVGEAHSLARWSLPEIDSNNWQTVEKMLGEKPTAKAM
jgi:hypothetical protein